MPFLSLAYREALSILMSVQFENISFHNAENHDFRLLRHRLTTKWHGVIAAALQNLIDSISLTEDLLRQNILTLYVLKL